MLRLKKQYLILKVLIIFHRLLYLKYYLIMLAVKLQYLIQIAQLNYLVVTCKVVHQNIFLMPLHKELKLDSL